VRMQVPSCLRQLGGGSVRTASSFLGSLSAYCAASACAACSSASSACSAASFSVRAACSHASPLVGSRG